MDKVVEEVCNDLKRRSKLGIKKYGITLEKEDLPLRDWLQHALEEAMDFSVYIKKIILELDKIDAEKRSDI